MRRPAAAFVLLLLLVPAPSSDAQSGSGDAPLLRLYGCGDDLDHGATTPTLGPDGRIDCTGDLVRFRAAWLAGATDAGLRAALPTHDQRVDLTLRYHPVYWAPAPGTTGDPVAEVALPGAPDRGLFDGSTTTPGRFDARFLSDEDLSPDADDDDVPDRIDRAPHDGLVDREARNDGRDATADLYFPALETRYDLTWWRTAPDPEPLPSGGALLLPGVAPVAGLSNPDAWASDGEPPRTHWHATPFGLGTGYDQVGALVTAPVTLRPGETARFLDHSVRLDRFVDEAGRMSASIDVRFAGRTTPTTIGSGFLLDLEPEDQRIATLSSAGTEARNVLFADTRAVTRTTPTLAADESWFVLLTALDDAASPQEATLRIGRIVSPAAPHNTVLSDGGLYRVTGLNERDGALHTFAWSQVHPLGEDFRFRSMGVDVRGVDPDARLPLLPPFERDHVHLDDIRPDVARDAYGFLQERSGSNGVIATGELALSPGAATPADRARRSDPLEVRWRDRGNEIRLAPSIAHADGSVSRSVIAPLRYVAVTTDQMALVHSSLLDDTGLVIGATSSPASPRAARSFVFDPNDPFLPYVDRGLHLYGGTRANPNAADVLRLGTAIIHPSEHIGQTRLPSALAAQRIDLDVRHQPYHIYETTGRGLRPVSDESIDRDIDADADPHIVEARRDALGDNLYDVAPRNNDPALGDIYGPVLQLRYTGQLIDPGTYRPIDAPFDPNTRIFVPAADRDPARPGLDSTDLNGDGTNEGIVLAGYWDRDAAGAAHDRWETVGPFDAGRDLVLLQSPLLEVPLGGDARFFDHGVQYVSFDGASRGTGTFRLLDLQDAWNETAVPTIAEAPNVGAGDERCLSIRRDGASSASVVACASRQAADLAHPYAVAARHDKWWVEVVQVGAASASIRMSRVIAPAADDQAMWVAGARYDWQDWTPGEATGVAAWQLTALVPLGTDVFLPPGEPAARLAAVPHGGLVPVLPPFDAPHLLLPEVDVAPLRDAHGMDGTEAAVQAADRVRRVDALLVQVEERDQARAHRFVHLDPTRWSDPGRAPGHAFVGATFADPWHGIVSTEPWLARTPDRLKVTPTDGFAEALRSGGDRGWDHYVRLDLPFDHAPYRLDSNRLGAPERIVVSDPDDPWTVGRTSGYLAYHPAEQRDPFVIGGTIVARPPVVSTPDPAPGPTVPPEPGRGSESEDGSAVGFVVAIALVAVLAARRRIHA